jgi:hypothetical protein
MPLRSIFSPRWNQDPDANRDLSRVVSHISDSIYPHPRLLLNTSTPTAAMETFLTLISKVLTDEARATPPTLIDPHDLQHNTWWYMTYPYDGDGVDTCMMIDPAKVKTLGDPNVTQTRLFVSKKNGNNTYLNVFLGKAWRAPLDHKKGKEKVITSAHRMIYWCFHGPIPDGMQVNHSCENSMCLNPRHLKAGDRRDNYNDWFNGRGRGLMRIMRGRMRGRGRGP